MIQVTKFTKLILIKKRITNSFIKELLNRFLIINTFTNDGLKTVKKAVKYLLKLKTAVMIKPLKPRKKILTKT